ncbi:rhodanese domain-containing protein CG4456-like [Lampetra planeri]
MLCRMSPRLLIRAAAAAAAAPSPGVRSGHRLLLTNSLTNSSSHRKAPPLPPLCSPPGCWGLRAVSGTAGSGGSGGSGASGVSRGELEERSVTFVQLRELIRAGGAYVVDVREAWEVHEYGGLPGAINIPLLQLEECLRLPATEFERRFQRAPPSRCGDSLVFSCLAGVRSLHALTTATRLGYSRAVHYPGGWEEWSKKEKK